MFIVKRSIAPYTHPCYSADVPAYPLVAKHYCRFNMITMGVRGLWLKKTDSSLPNTDGKYVVIITKLKYIGTSHAESVAL